MKNLIKGGLALGVALVLAAAALPAKKVLLRYNLPNGKTFTTVSVSNIKMYEDKSLTKQVMSMDLDQTFDAKVAGKKDNATVLDIVIKRIKMNQSMQGMTMKFDSDLENQEDMMGAMVAQQFEGILNKKGSMSIDSRGAVVAEFSMEEDSPAAEQMGSSMKQSFIEYPEKEVGEGDSWSGDMNMSGMPGKTTVTYTIEKIESKVVKVKVSGSAVGEAKTDGGSANVDLKFNGNLEIDRATGIIVSSTFSHFMETDNPMGEGKMFATISMKSSTTSK